LDNIADSNTKYLWDCIGLRLGTTDHCSKDRPVSGLCGAANNECIYGVLVDTTDNATQFNWSCAGLNGGKTVNCSLNK
jgi:hypothetical protein